MKLTVRYELKHQPFSVGDVLSTALCSRIVAKDNGFSQRAFYFVVSSERVPNTVYNGTDMLPLLAGIDDIRYVSENHSEEAEWPPRDSPYLWDYCNFIFDREFHRNGTYPHFEDIGGFEERGYVSINLRKQDVQSERNSSDAWFHLMETHPMSHFVVVGDVKPPDLRNVTYLYGDLRRDLSAIQHSDFHMGTGSGPCQIVRFSDKPYAIFDIVKRHWIWATQKQVWTDEADTLENLEREYARLA